METSTDAPPLPAAIYCRISRDQGGAGLGVERQETDCRVLAERLGWQVVAVYVDNDVSAYSGAPRPQYRAMLQAVRDGQVKGIVAWHPDRLHRRATELEEFVTVAETYHLQVQSVTAGIVDLSSASGRMIARMLGAAAQHEVDHTRERVKRAKAQMAADGKYRGGMRPYGYESDGVTVREAEAAVVREAATAVLAGRSLAAVARDMSDRGLTTSRGKPWNYGLLRDVLIRPRNAGLLSQGRADRGRFEIVGPAVWPAIVEEETWRAVYALLTDPARRSVKQSNAPRWLGAGLYRCGLCGELMRSAPFGGTPSRKGRRKYHYRCTATAHLTVLAGPTDEYVRGVVADLVRDPRVIAAMTPQGDDQLSADRERRLALVTRLEQFENDYATGAVTGTQLAKATAVVSSELAEVEARLTEGLRRSTASPIANAVDPGEAFLNAPLDVQRAVLAAVLRVEVIPADRKGGRWTSQRLRITPVA